MERYNIYILNHPISRNKTYHLYEDCWHIKGLGPYLYDSVILERYKLKLCSECAKRQAAERQEKQVE